MALETGDYIGDLVATNPTSTDPKSAGDDHFRLMKKVVKECFAGFAGAVIVRATETGTAAAHVLTPTPALVGYVVGTMLLYRPTNAGTGALTVNVSALGAKSVKLINGADPTSGDIVVNQPLLLMYDGTNFVCIGGSPYLMKTGDQTLTGNLTLIGNLAQTGNQSVTGNISATGTLAVTGASTFTGDIGGTGGNKKADKAGSVYTGTHDFSAATSVLVPTATLNGQAVNYAQLIATAMSAALPGQSLGLLISSGTVPSFSKTLTGFALDEVKGADIASAATIVLSSGTATGNLLHITGTTTITAITLASGAERTLVFDGILTLTHNATTLILPGGQNITTSAGDTCRVRGDGAGNVRVVAYNRATASPGFQAKGTDVASGSTVNLTTATGDFVHITGTTTITAITINSGDERTVVFDGALTLTHNATTLILPGAANITTAAGDRAIFRGDGAGNTRCIAYTKASGTAIVNVTPGWTLLSTVTASSSATVDIETTFDSTYDSYAIVINGLRPQTNNTAIYVTLKNAGSYVASNYHYHSGTRKSNSTSYAGIASDAGTEIRLTAADVSNATSGLVDLIFYISNPTNTVQNRPIRYTGGYLDSSNLATIIEGVGGTTTAGALTGVRVAMSSGNVFSGTFRVFGIKNS